jgi:predicted  nucleic acid-binding Zn-ribbon protein
MSIESRRELEVTRAKLKLLEERLAALRQKPAENRRAQEWSVRSLTQAINQLKEEIARFESRTGSPTPNP